MNEYAVPVDEAMSRLDVIPDYDAGNGPGPCVHTIMGQGFMLGAHWYLPAVREAFERWGVEESGDTAKAMQHGLVVVEDRDNGRRVPVFFATKAAA